MESKEVSVQTGLDFNSFERLRLVVSHTNSPRRPARSEKTLKIKNLHVEKMRMKKLMTFTINRNEKHSNTIRSFKSHFLERLKNDVSSLIVKDNKKLLQLSCQGRHLDIRKKEEKIDEWAKSRWPGESSTERSKKVALNTVQLFEGKEKGSRTCKSFRESKVLPNRMLKKIGHLKVKYEALNCLK